MGWIWVCTTFLNNENGGLLKLKLKLKLSLNGVFSGGSGCTTSPLLLPLLLLRYLCYHYSLLLYHSLSLSLSGFFFSLHQSINTQPPLFLSVFFIPGKKKQNKDSIEKEKERERETVCQIFFFLYIYIDCGRFCIFCFSFVYDFSFSFQSVRPFRKRYIKKSSVVNIFTKATIHIILFHPKLCYAFLFFILNLDFFFF